MPTKDSLSFTKSVSTEKMAKIPRRGESLISFQKLKRLLFDLGIWVFVRFCDLFHLPKVEKIKTLSLLLFPAKGQPYMEQALFDRPIRLLEN